MLTKKKRKIEVSVISDGSLDVQLNNLGSAISPPTKFILYKERWWIVLIVSFLQVTNAMLWVAFSAVPNMAASYFMKSINDLNWLTTLNFIADVVFSLPAMWMIEKCGLRYVIFIAGGGTCLGGTLRLFGTFDFVPLEYRFNITLAAQSVIATAFPFIMCCPTAVSQFWFPEKHRVYITTVCILTSNLGLAIASILISNVVPTPSHLYFANHYTCPPAIIVGILSFTVLHSKPPTPPSPSAGMEKLKEETDFLKQFAKIFKNHNLMLLIICGGGLTFGIPTVLYLLAQQFLCPWGYSNEYIGYISFVFILMGTVPSILLGVVAEKTTMYEEVMKISTALAGVFLAAIYLLSQQANMRILLGFVFAFYGFLSFSAWPLISELAVETSFPSNEGAIGKCIVLFGNVQSAIIVPLMMQFVRPFNKMQTKLQTCTVGGLNEAYDMTYPGIFLLAVNTFQCVVIIIFCRPKFKRRNVEIMNTQKAVGKTVEDSGLNNSVH